LRDTLQASVKRIGHIPDGDIACVYEIEVADEVDVGSDSSDCIPVEENQTSSA
jgi:hypothetical protein